MDINAITNRTIVRVLTIILAYVGVLWLVLQLQRELVWIATAFFLALTLNPAVVWFQKYMPRRNRVLAISSVFLVMCVVIAGISSVLIPPLLDQSQNLAQEFPQLIDDVQRSDSALGQFINNYDLVDRIKAEQKQIFESLGKATGSFVGIAQSLFSNLIAVVVVLTLTFLTLVEGPTWLRTLISTQKPSDQKKHRELVFKLYDTVKSYTTGNLLRSLIITIATLVPLLLLGIPYALPLSLLMGILNLIPLIGATIGSVILVIVCLFVSVPAALFMAVYLLVYQQLENNLIQPIIFGRALQISAFTVLVAALIGASLAGFLGAFVAIPIAASIRIFFDHFNKYYAKKA